MHTVVLVLYLLPVLLILSYGVVQLVLVIHYLAARKKEISYPEVPSVWPKVVVQLPIYNEKYVIERLIKQVAQLDYPLDKLEIQVLDDSTDETTELVQKALNALPESIQSIYKHIRRPERRGYKAGALAYGLTQTDAEFVAIFDADFLPAPTFLKKTIPHFHREEVGVVQTRWAHLNASFSLLTELQGFGLDAHFTIEQVGRNSQNHFINFNGTAGVWRTKTIEEAGGWEADTLTEDLDLSYRAQVKGWEFVYLRDVASPAELPVSMEAIKSQQYRWMKGGAECLVKNTKRVFYAKGLSLSTRLHGFFHLLNSSIFVGVFFSGLLSLPAAWVISQHRDWAVYAKWTAFFQVSWVVLGFFYWLAYSEQKQSFWRFLRLFLSFLTFMMGLSLHNALAVLEGYTGRKTPFVRTPKFNVSDMTTSWKSNIYLTKKVPLITSLEAGLGLYYIFAVL
ncbi:MAG: cellulose synthase family protein, partial [Spirosomataceae bacterium]